MQVETMIFCVHEKTVLEKIADLWNVVSFEPRADGKLIDLVLILQNLLTF
jgi:hypothetical protein